MSRNRSSRPSSKETTSRTWGSRGRAAGTTKSWPVILRWIVRIAGPDSSMTSCLPRRPTPRIRRPASAAPMASGWCVRSVGGQRQVAPTIVASMTRPRRSRATVSTSGSSGISAPRRDLVGLVRLVGLGELGKKSVAAGDGRHRFPVIADLDVDRQGHAQGQGALHDLAEDRHEPFDLLPTDLQEELVVDLQERPRPEAPRREPGIEPDHRDLDNIRGRALDRHVDRHSLAGTPKRGVTGVELRDLPLPPQERLDEAIAAGPLPDFGHVIADSGIRREVRGDELLGLLPADPGPAREAEVAHP